MGQVEGHAQLDIADWHESPRSVVSRTRPARQLWSPTVIGILGTLLLHSILLPSALLGSRARKAHVPEIQELGLLVKSNADAAESLVLITLPTLPAVSNSSQQTIQSVSSLPALSKLTPVSPINPDPPAFLNIEVLTLGEDQAANSTANSGDGIEQARLFGIYTGQIQARINRIWRRPRTPVNAGNGPDVLVADESFQCQAQVVQDSKGNVQEILVPRCNGSPAWQRSLVIAIQQASPLPAPPSASVFSHSITLNFVGLSYVPGSADEDYDIATSKVAQTNEMAPRLAVPGSNQPSNAVAALPTSLDSRN
jgi:TonB C terminal